MPRLTSFKIHDSETPRSRSTSWRRAQLFEGVERGLDQVDGIGRAEALGEYVVNAGRFANRADRGAGDHAGARAGRDQHHVGRAELSLDRMRDGAAIQRNFEHAAGAVFDGLFDAGRHFVGLAVAPADFARPLPTTTMAAKLKRRPPLTTAAQRLILMTLSISSPRFDSFATARSLCNGGDRRVLTAEFSTSAWIVDGSDCSNSSHLLTKCLTP